MYRDDRLNSAKFYNENYLQQYKVDINSQTGNNIIVKDDSRTDDNEQASGRNNSDEEQGDSR